MAEAAEAAPVQTDTSAAAPTGTQAASASPPPAAPVTAGDAQDAAGGTDLVGSGQASPTSDLEWTTVLDDDTRRLVEQKGYKSPNDLGKAYRELTRKLGERAPEPPGANTAPEAEDAFYKFAGRPEKPEDYKFGLPEGVPEHIPYDANFATEFKNWAHKAGLNPRQASALHDAYITNAAQQMAAVQQNMAERIESAHKVLTKEWGGEDSPDYRMNVEYARRALVQLELKDALMEGGLLDQRGRVTNPRVAKALSRIGAKMFGEDTMYAGPSASVNNPFSKQSFNMTEQARIIKSDPARAATLVRASGQSPADFGLDG